jgi:OmpA-OmpF porin, OOP family
VNEAFLPFQNEQGSTMKSKAKKGLAILGLASAMAFTNATLAQDAAFYVGGALGQAEVDIDCDGATSCDEKDTSWRIFGGYQFNKNFAVELGYINFGESSASGPVPPFGTGSVKFESTAFDLVAVGVLPLANQFSVYGKLGLYRADTDIDLNVTALGSASRSDSNTDLTFGIGARYDFTRNLGVRAEWQRYSDVAADDFGESDIDVISLGVLWRF